jgi:desulfoferrodoxin (superoxide reductase-like protein)
MLAVAVCLLATASLRSPTKLKSAFAVAADDYLPDGNEPPVDQIFSKDHKQNMHIAKEHSIKHVGKIGAHVPHLTLRGNRDSDDWILHLDVRHEWNDDHHISHLYVKDEHGGVVGGKDCPTADACKDDEEDGVLSFDLQVPEGTTTLTPFARCNKHGTWRGTTFPVPPKHHEL